MIALPSPDGNWIYYTKTGLSGLWRIPVSGGAEGQVLKSPSNGFQGYWALTRDGIYYLDTKDHPGAIRFAAFSSLDRSSLVHDLAADPTPWAGLSVSPDGQWLAYATMAEASSNITLIENLR
jgi:Tol biopolymer transport system component